MNEENKLMGLGHVRQSLELIVSDWGKIWDNIILASKLLDQHRLLFSLVISGVNNNPFKSSMHIPILNPIIGLHLKVIYLLITTHRLMPQIYNGGNPERGAVQFQ